MNRLTEAVGAKAVADAGRLVLPGSRDATVAAFRACAEHGIPISLSSSERVSNPGKDKRRVLISLATLERIDLEPRQMLVRAEAGVMVSSLRDQLGKSKLVVAGLSAGVAEHVGSLVARGEIPARALCGIEVVLPTGEFVHQGGRVLKDVAGYSLASLFLGSGGRYGAVLAVSLRVQPAGAETFVAPPPGLRRDPGQPDLRTVFDPKGLLATA